MTMTQILKKSQIKIAFDIDGVLCDFNTEFVRRVNEQFGLDIKPEKIISYDYIEEKVLGTDACNSFFEHAISDGIFAECLPYPEAQIMLSKIFNDPRYDVYFITARGTEPGIYWTPELLRKVKQDTKEWLSAYFPQFDQKKLTFTRKKDEFIYKIGIEMMVEDKLSTANSLASLCKSLLLTRPWNVGETVATRINSIAELTFWL